MSNDTLFYKIYLASRKSISRVVSRIVPPDEIEDIVQETYVRICQIENKEHITSPKSFMYRTARNLALDYLKQANVKLVDRVDDIQTLEYLLSSDSDEMYENTLTSNEFSHFCEAVRQLPTQCRKVFVLKKVYGYSQREIAAQLNLSESTVEKHISTGMKRSTLFMRNINKQVNSPSSSLSPNIAGGTHE
ncbi:MULTISPECIES: RNA polymerase sigma factor [unclassified Colwellia]|jgi:RNA polymerase sigma-70 factor (ECF subfamily)|uniref:RNA polymerase sigma factor n=1 Tax=unclassified Colwellia TaxID=196834 RepID=UPI0015F3860D|nr:MULTISPECIES: RNA polymerase sigma factor [unclassified Colwellia]MBA6234054.1 RNA polymerase sigma factor [Colwellia sp. MB02u-7]MBA6238024.1 RNA polymerase sigma factor [Colwellia sp. MB02u-11]MBA6257649.1 RNA polymerase sigma factor [Colwellia sp. MB3u-28]MBA6259406.1 RNA polymerase sigma factor [Colwellia sp. MB3u-41]MBA6300728.1 RNA polymerase sigma factor [Colwellia sp. MB3u-22]